MATKKIRKIKVFIHAEFKSNDGIFWEMELISDLRAKMKVLAKKIVPKEYEYGFLNISLFS